MLKFMFLICILVALVHESVSKPTAQIEVQKFDFHDCMARREKLPVVLEQQDAHKRGQLAFEICLAEKSGIINDDKTVNKEKLDKEAPDSEISRDYRNCVSSAVEEARPEDTKLDIYVNFGKCYTLAMENPPVINENNRRKYSHGPLLPPRVPIVSKPFVWNRRNSFKQNMEQILVNGDTSEIFVLLGPEDNGPSYKLT